MLAQDLLVVIAAYLVGSFSSAILISRLLSSLDPRNFGSNNAGATNILRIHGKLPALLTLVIDVAKGFVPVFVAIYYEYALVTVSLSAVSVCLGHVFPLYFEFRGGKGVATALGALFALEPSLALCCFAIWIAVFLMFRLSSMAALTALICAPLVSLWLAPQYVIATTGLAWLIIWRHRANISRLMKGTEKRM